ncbi:MAG: hypothetical protein US57_C0005G0020 [Candidatus Moranbacteria bacterium GW2011_GWC2_37_73]|nr:MAG: hypothetical protein UR95_C0001G0127 [Parcubacteria group bacterium GW2011_GWC1_36_108]KKQ40064.1 MAG: hypothetical protein US57_C0005G0020 [Candidatus Moranbacteria bacterium GW2011_GWC2_37_73]
MRSSLLNLKEVISKNFTSHIPNSFLRSNFMSNSTPTRWAAKSFIPHPTKSQEKFICTICGDSTKVDVGTEPGESTQCKCNSQ